MAKITELDKKILYELDKDGRATFSQIAKELGTTPQVVKYHYHRFLDEGIIKNFWAFIDYDKAGYSTFWGYWLKFSGLSKEKETGLYEYLNSNLNIPIVMRCDGYADVLIAIIAKDVFEHNRILQDFLAEFGKYITMTDILVGIGFIKFPRSYLVDKENQKNIAYQSGGTTKIIKLSSVDRKILSILQIDGRIDLTKIAEILHVSKSLIYKRYNRLVEKEVISKTTFTFNHKELGMQLYRNAFKITRFDKEKMDKFYKYCLNHPNINNYVKVMGKWQVLIDFEVNNKEHMRDILREMRYEFNDIINEIAVNEIYKIDKFSQMVVEYPELIKK